MARLPLLPIEPGEPRGDALDGPLLEAVQFASRARGRLATDGLGVDERLAATVRAYERRARTRPTPRGAFAGVQVAHTVNGQGRRRMGSAHRARSMPSAGWLNDLAQQLVETQDVLPRLRLTSNNLVFRRGTRFEHEYPTGPGPPMRVTLRATPAVSLIQDVCRTGATLDQVVRAVTAAWEVPEPTICATVLEMVRTGFLLTDLLPVHLADDPLRHVLSKLPGTSAVAETLAAIRKHLHQADLYPPGAPERLAALTAARDLCDAIARHEAPITVDVLVDADIQIPASLVSEAADAVGLLWGISPTLTTLASYHSRFVERYGIDRRVPLLSVVDAVTGLGDPDPGPGIDIDADTSRARTRVLAGLIASATAHGEHEVVLDDVTVAALRVRDDGVPPPQSGEIYARMVAASADDFEAGRYELAGYIGGTQEAGSTLGRFATLLPDGRSAGRQDGAALTAEVVVRPRSPKLDTVALPAGFCQTRIGVGLAPRPDDLTPDDLEVSSDGHRFTLWSRSRDQAVIPALYSRIGPSFIPPVARLLEQIARSGTRPWRSWSWGPLSEAPFQPRVRWRRIILSPARWRLPHTMVAASTHPTGWSEALARWRAVTAPRLPHVVVIEDGDRRLPLDLGDVGDVELLRRYVRRGIDAVTEPPGGPDAVQGIVAGPDGFHVLELVIPVSRSQPVAQPEAPPRPAASSAPVVYLPGSQWLSVAIASPATSIDELLAHVGDMAEAVRQHHDRWFWLRYDNVANGPHLRVRFSGDPGTLAAHVLPTISERCATLMTQGLVGRLVLEPYEPEIDRYGGADAIEAAERVFQADSHLVLASLALWPDADRRLMLTALSAVAITRVVADGDVAALGRPRLGRKARRRVNALRHVVPARIDGLIDDTEREPWAARDRALTAYRDRLPPLRRAGCASSVIHMHANRIGANRDEENMARALALHLLPRNAP